ncbi:hypothetical protein H8N00_10580, partial [Streptomyces sp. AC563]
MTRSHHRYVDMELRPDPEANPYTVRATCVTCADQSPEPEPSESMTSQMTRAQRWCTAHAARDYPGGRHFRYAGTTTLRWLVTP